jgi:hypothetical protein
VLPVIDIDGEGLTVIVKVCTEPVHPLAVGVTVIVAVTEVVPGLVAVNAAMFPVPVAASPIEVLLLLQLKIVPLTDPVKLTAVVDVPLQTV